MYAILALCLIGGLICGGHAVAALIELVAQRNKLMKSETHRAIDDAQVYREAAKAVVVDQKHAATLSEIFDVRDCFPTGRR